MVEFQDEDTYSPPTNIHCTEDTAPENTSIIMVRKHSDTFTRRAKSYPPPLTASLLKKSKVKFYVPPQDLVLTSDEEDDDVSATAATNRLLVIYGKTIQPNRNQVGRISKAEKEKLNNTANPVPSTSEALSRQMKAVIRKSSTKSIRPPTKVQRKQETISPPSSAESRSRSQLPSSAHAQPSRRHRRSEVKLKVSSKKRKTEVPSRKRKIPAREEKDGESEEASPDTKKFRAEVSTSPPDEDADDVKKEVPELSSEDNSGLLKTEPGTVDEATDGQIPVESQLEEAQAQSVTTTSSDGAEGKTETTITKESSTSMEPSQSESEVIKEKVPKRGKVKKRSVLPPKQRPRAKKSSAAATDPKPPAPPTEVRKSGRIRQPPRDNECWVFA